MLCCTACPPLPLERTATAVHGLVLKNGAAAPRNVSMVLMGDGLLRYGGAQQAFHWLGHGRQDVGEGEIDPGPPMLSL
jgi:hypothetical protein